MRGAAFILAVLLAMAVLASAIAGDTAASGSEATLARLTAKAGRVTSIKSRFTQEKRLGIFKQTMVSRGVFAFRRPASLRWEYLDPVRSGFVLDAGAGTRWNDLSGESRDFTVERDPVMRLVSSQILLWTTLDLKALSRAYRIEVEADSPAVLRFIPLDGDSGPVKSMRITFSPDDLSIAAIEIIEAEGDSTTIHFDATELDKDLNGSLFKGR